MPIGKNIKSHLEDRHLRQSDLAQAIGVSNGTLSDWIKGRFYPRKKYIDAMAEYFGVSVDELTKEKDTNLDERLMSLFNSLSEDSKNQAIDYMKFLLHQRERG